MFDFPVVGKSTFNKGIVVEAPSVSIYWALLEFAAEGIIVVEKEIIVETLSEFEF